MFIKNLKEEIEAKSLQKFYQSERSKKKIFELKVLLLTDITIDKAFEIIQTDDSLALILVERFL